MVGSMKRYTKDVSNVLKQRWRPKEKWYRANFHL